MKHMFFVAAFVVLVCGVASAEIPQVLGYQGRITDNSGVPVADGTYAVRFRIYDDETAGTLLWDSNDDSVVVAGGAFSVMLGESPHPTLNLAFDEDYWLLVTFDGENQLPRKRLGSVGYAYMASGIVPGTETVDSRSIPIFKGTNLGTGAGLRGDSEQGDGVRGQSSATDGKGVYGVANATTGYNYGVHGTSGSTYGSGVYGTSTATTGSTYGGRFESSSTTFGRGVYAWAKGGAGETVGVYGVNSSPSGYAIRGEADATTGTNYGVYGRTNSSSGYGVFGEAAATAGANYGVYGETNSTDGYGGYFDGRGYFSGNVGIGTTSPGAKLDVRGTAVFNEDGADSDFRVEGDTDENLVFVDAGANKVGIRTDTPAVALHVNGTARFNKVGIGTDSPVTALDVRGSIEVAPTAGDPRRVNIYTWFSSGWIDLFGADGSLNCRMAHGNDLGYGRVVICDDENYGKAGMEVDASGDGYIWADTKNFRMANPNQPDTEIWYACIEGPEAAAYIRGTARLENGRASITFPDHFQAVATAEGMTVQLTPRSAESEGLAVTEQSVEGIEVRELRNGTGSYEFHYTVMAVRKGYEDYQVIRPAMEAEPIEPPPAPGT